jgi:ABC-type sugar transport system permease subunit
MNIVISRSRLNSSGTLSTELRYGRLIREHGAKVWTLVLTIIFMPMVIVIALAAIVWRNHAATLQSHIGGPELVTFVQLWVLQVSVPHICRRS